MVTLRSTLVVARFPGMVAPFVQFAHASLLLAMPGLLMGLMSIPKDELEQLLLMEPDDCDSEADVMDLRRLQSYA